MQLLRFTVMNTLMLPWPYTSNREFIDLNDEPDFFSGFSQQLNRCLTSS